MSQELVIWLPVDLSAPWAWTFNDVQSGWATTETERAALSDLGASTISVICPGQWVRVFAHELPAMKAKDRIRAAGFAIEDQLAAPLTDQHIVMQDDPVQRVGVIALDKMNAVRERFSAAGIAPSRMAS